MKEATLSFKRAYIGQQLIRHDAVGSTMTNRGGAAMWIGFLLQKLCSQLTTASDAEFLHSVTRK